MSRLQHASTISTQKEPIVRQGQRKRPRKLASQARRSKPQCHGNANMRPFRTLRRETACSVAKATIQAQARRIVAPNRRVRHGNFYTRTLATFLTACDRLRSHRPVSPTRPHAQPRVTTRTLRCAFKTKKFAQCPLERLRPSDPRGKARRYSAAELEIPIRWRYLMGKTPRLKYIAQCERKRRAGPMPLHMR